MPARRGTRSESTRARAQSVSEVFSSNGNASKSMSGFGAPHTSVGGSCPCRNDSSTFVSCDMPETASPCPMFGLTEPIR